MYHVNNEKCTFALKHISSLLCFLCTLFHVLKSTSRDHLHIGITQSEIYVRSKPHI